MTDACVGAGDASTPEDIVALSPIKVGMLLFLASEAAFFGTLIMTYLYFLRQQPTATRIRARCFACRWSWPHRPACSPAA